MDDKNFRDALTPAEDMLSGGETVPPVEEEEEEISTFRYFLQVVYRLRAVFLSVPIAIAAVLMAFKSRTLLPEKVGIFMQANATYQFYVDRPLAIVVPLVLTAICLTITLCSKKVTFPWCISLFSLILPALLWLTSALTT